MCLRSDVLEFFADGHEPLCQHLCHPTIRAKLVHWGVQPAHLRPDQSTATFETLAGPFQRARLDVVGCVLERDRRKCSAPSYFACGWAYSSSSADLNNAIDSSKSTAWRRMEERRLRETASVFRGSKRTQFERPCNTWSTFRSGGRLCCRRRHRRGRTAFGMPSRG